MRVMVTGGCGMIGFHIARFYAENGDNVFVVDNLERSKLLGHEVSQERRTYNFKELEALGCKMFPLDISSTTTWRLVPRPDVIFHMAAQCGVPTSIDNPTRDFEVNTVGTQMMLEHARKSEARVVYASTNKVYPIHDAWEFDGGSNIEGQLRNPRWLWRNPVLNEQGWPIRDDLRGSLTPYGTSKRCGDLLCQEYYHTFGVPTGVFRMSCIYGDHQFGFEEQGWATWFAIATLKGDPIKIYGDGHQVRDMLWVGDLVQAYHKFATSTEVHHGVWNMGGGPRFTMSLNECLDILERLTGKRSEISYHDWRPSDQKVYTSDIRPVVDALDWDPEVSPMEGMARVVDWVGANLEIF